MTNISTETVREAAHGQWLSILGALAPDLSPAIQRVGRHVPCPVHGGRDGFRLFRDAGETGGGICNSCGEFGDGFSVLMWINGWDFPEAKRAVADVLRLDGGPQRLAPPARRPRPVNTEPTPAEIEARRTKLLEVWRGTRSDDGTIATYLKGRGLYLPVPESLRLHPGLPYYEEGQHLGTYPTMIARIQALDGTRVSIHRTYLAPGGKGKAPVLSPKKIMTPIKNGASMGAAVRLTEAGEVLGLAEGIETALAVMDAWHTVEQPLPMWATVTAGGMETVQIPETVWRVEIWADNDKSGRGQEAAEILAQRLHDQGKEVFVLVPTTEGTDWLDVLNTNGPKAIWEAREQTKPWAPSQLPPNPIHPPTARHVAARRERKPPMTARQLSQLPPPTFLVKDYVPEGGLTVLYGPSGAGKSFVALDWALSVAAGRPWFGRDVQHGNVIYLASEGVFGYAKRVRAWERGRNAPGAFDLPIYFDPAPVHLMEQAEVDAFVALNAVLNPRLVVIDTLARNAAGADENSARDMGRVIDGADRIRTGFGASVVLVHHTAKGSNTERGSGAIRGAADSMVYLTLQDDIILLGVDKAKDSEPPDSFGLRLFPVLHSDSCVVEIADAVQTEKLTSAQRKALRDLNEVGGSATINKWMQMADMKLSHLMPVVNALVSKGYVDAPEPGSKGGKYTIASNGLSAI